MYRRSLRKIPWKIRKFINQEIKDELREIFDKINRPREHRDGELSSHLMLR